MKIYLVGGATRDLLMGIKPKDRDFVVTGSSIKEMLDLGYKQVGADFPVFLHPESKEEYALARTEERVGEGYNGFECHTEEVTLEEDLSRRDLTINAISLEEHDPDTLSFDGFVGGKILHDPFNGQQDIKDKVLRHTTASFAEDPVRVLRVARFLARFGPEWTVAPETVSLCEQLVFHEFKNLTAERVFLEMEKALKEPHPWLFFKFLRKIGENHWFKELNDLWDIPQREDFHPEKWTFLHTMLCLESGVKLWADPVELFAILCHDFGKAAAYDRDGTLIGHESLGMPLVEEFCDRLKVPLSYRNLAEKVTYWHTYGHNILKMRPVKVMKLFKGLDLFRKPHLLDNFIRCNMADARGRGPKFESVSYPQADYLRNCLRACQVVDTQAVALICGEQGLTGEAIGNKVHAARVNAIKQEKLLWES